jgi:hypothetical protein
MDDNRFFTMFMSIDITLNLQIKFTHIQNTQNYTILNTNDITEFCETFFNTKTKYCDGVFIDQPIPYKDKKLKMPPSNKTTVTG